ncbi:MAG: hypothetical protein AAF512_17240 [Pseudomonadota bacterium]
MKTALHVFFVSCLLVVMWMFIRLDFFMWGINITLREADEVNARVNVTVYRLEYAAHRVSSLISTLRHSQDTES